MSLVHKRIIKAGLLLCCFLAITSFDIYRSSLIIYLSLVINFSILLLCFFYKNEIMHELRDQAHLKLLKNNENLSVTSHVQYDELTSLPNRVLFNESLHKAVSHAKRHNKILAVLIVEMNNFKNINIAYGYETGNSVIKEVADKIKHALRTEDVLARLNGDEFVILLNDIKKPKFASTVAKKILAACTQELTFVKNKINLQCSIGICIYPNDGLTLEDLLSHSEAALYKAKRAVNAYQFYTHEMDIEAQEYSELESGLKQAIKNNELVLYYQPKLNIKKGAITGIEALIRWQHPKLGLINPAKFIPVAEDTGLMLQIGEWALREACKTNKFWQDEGYMHFPVAVNLSHIQFNFPYITETISKILVETNLNPIYLELEMTESIVMNDIVKAKSILEKIKSTGVQLSIDHFGTGYTSISHLKQLPVSVIKIDQNFIKGLPNIPDDLAIVSGIIALVHNLGLEVVAEGVETAEQVEYLAKENCDMVQGYYLSHPQPAHKIISEFKKLTDEVIL